MEVNSNFKNLENLLLEIDNLNLNSEHRASTRGEEKVDKKVNKKANKNINNRIKKGVSRVINSSTFSRDKKIRNIRIKQLSGGGIFM